MSLSPGDALLVTGTSPEQDGPAGILGRQLSRLASDRGFRVRAMASVGDDRAWAEPGSVEMIDGNPSDIGRLSRAMEGCRLVVHTAGKLSDWGSRREFLDRNVTGTANVVDACREAGVERLVHVSSLTVLGLPRHGRVVDEETPVDPGATDPYTASRIAAERIAMEAHGRGLAVTMVRSGVIWGAGDRSIVPRLAGLLRRGRMMLIDGGRNLIALSHVENLAGGILGAAGESAAAGRLYHLTDGEEITARAAVEGIARAVGVSPPSMSLPFGLVYAAAALVEGLARLSGRAEPPAMTRYGVRLLACHCRYDISRARREIAYRPAVTFQDGMSRLSAWLHLAPAPPEVARA